MSNEAIPEDILYVAGMVVADITDDTRMTLMGEVEKMAEPIARAIMAERERCAAIAEAHGDTWNGSRDSFQCVQEAAVDAKVEEIVRAIRSHPKKLPAGDK